MSIRIGSNIASLKGLRSLSEVESNLSKVFERLSSGMRINRASDDAAGLSIASSLEADARVYTQGIRNLNDGISLLQIADGALEQLSVITTRISELSEQSANGVYQTKQRQALDREAQALALEYKRILESTKFNDISLFSATERELRLQDGYGLEGSLAITLGTPYPGILIPNGTFQPEQLYATGDVYIALDFGDVNHDGAVDVLASHTGSSPATFLILGNGDGTFKARTAIQISGGGNERGVFADVNNDGDLDLVVSDHATDTLRIRLGNGNGTFDAAIIQGTGFDNDTQPVIGDFNNDSKLDVIIGDFGSGTQLLLGNGDGTFGSAIALVSGVQHATDLNGDGNLDLIYQNVGIALGIGDGTFQATVTYASGGVDAGSALEDFDNDGDTDIVRLGSGSAFRMYQNNGNGIFSELPVIPTTTASPPAASADMNGDGKADFLYKEGVLIQIYFGNGDMTFKAPITVSASGGGNRVYAHDVNNDGVDDIIAAMNGFGVHLGNGDLSVSFPRFDLLTQASAREALDLAGEVLDGITAYRGRLGAMISRIESAANVSRTRVENIHAARSRIIDADVATDAAELIRLTILREAAGAVLSQANQQPALALSLLR